MYTYNYGTIGIEIGVNGSAFFLWYHYATGAFIPQTPVAQAATVYHLPQ
jgi:hypothetical protein